MGRIFIQLTPNNMETPQNKAFFQKVIPSFSKDFVCSESQWNRTTTTKNVSGIQKGKPVYYTLKQLNKCFTPE